MNVLGDVTCILLFFFCKIYFIFCSFQNKILYRKIRSHPGGMNNHLSCVFKQRKNLKVSVWSTNYLYLGRLYKIKINCFKLCKHKGVTNTIFRICWHFTGSANNSQYTWYVSLLVVKHEERFVFLEIARILLISYKDHGLFFFSLVLIHLIDFTVKYKRPMTIVKAPYSSYLKGARRTELIKQRRRVAQP